MTRQVGIRGEGNENGKCVTVNEKTNHETEVMGRNIVNEEEGVENDVNNKYKEKEVNTFRRLKSNKVKSR